MPSAVTFEAFEKELNRLVESFGKRLAELKKTGYAEAQLRDDFLNPLFRALGWDMENRAGLIQREREVEIESATQIGGGRKRADYLFRTDKRDRFVCEAKKPAEELHAKYAFQAKRYAWNKGVPVAVLTDFEELKIFIVGGKPHIDEPHAGEWKSYRFQQYPLVARELWDLLARDQIAAGSIDKALDALPKKSAGTGKTRQSWLIKPDRHRALDTDFLEFLDETRRDLASDIYKNNDHDELLAGNRLTEACQRVIDRILFLRICEDRDIDTGQRLQSIVERWRKNTNPVGDDVRSLKLDKEEKSQSLVTSSPTSLWSSVVRHFRALDRRPPTHVPFFNGNLFKPHFTETLVISDEWLAGFIGDLSDDESPYLFNIIDVEILGSVYERFLGKIVRPHGKGITIEEKPEVRKAGGVYYTPRYIVDYIVEQTAGKLLDEIAAEKETGGVKAFAARTEKLRLLDPACGSGSFLIRAFERVCEHWQKRLTADLRSLVGDAITSLKSKTISVGDDVRSLKPNTIPVGDDVRSLKPKESSQSLLTSSPTIDPGRSRGDETQTGKSFSQSLLASSPTVKDWQKKHRALCWVDDKTGDVHLTVELKRKILTQNIYGVDLDSAAVEVTQLSLYLKMLENENRTTLQRQRELLADEADIALLPPLQDNIKCGNSLIASDFSMMPADLVRVRAFDWPVQFAPILKAGGFDAVIGNPPYILLQDDFRDDDQLNYFRENYQGASYKLDTYHLFIEQGIRLCKKGGRQSFITPSNFLTNNHLDGLRKTILEKTQPVEIVVIDGGVFAGASVDTAIFVFLPGQSAANPFLLTRAVAEQTNFKPMGQDQVFPKRVLTDKAALFTSGIINPASELWDKISGKFAKLETIADVNFGKQLRDRSKFTKDVIEVTSRKAIPKTHVACVTGKDVQRYLLEWSNLACLNDTVAQSGGCWDEAKHKAKGKLLTRQIGEYPSFALDAVGYHCLNTIFMVTLLETAQVDSTFLLGVLNSKLLKTLWVGRFYDQRQTFPKIKGTYLKELPIALPDFKKPADKTRHDKLVVLVDKLLALMPKLRAATLAAEKAVLQNAVTATDQQIDALVYALYGLTPEEIKLIES